MLLVKDLAKKIVTSCTFDINIVLVLKALQSQKYCYEHSKPMNFNILNIHSSLHSNKSVRRDTRYRAVVDLNAKMFTNQIIDILRSSLKAICSEVILSLLR